MGYFFINTQLYNKFQRYLRRVTFHQLSESYMGHYLIIFNASKYFTSMTMTFFHP